jgi:hypothetical protein
MQNQRLSKTLTQFLVQRVLNLPTSYVDMAEPDIVVTRKDLSSELNCQATAKAIMNYNASFHYRDVNS